MVGFGGAILTSLNGVVGSGIFALPALLYSAAGSFSPVAILAFACLYATTLAVVAKLSTVFRQSGGAQLYAQHAFGEAVSFQVGWFTVAASMAGASASLHVMVSYLGAVFPVFDDPLLRLATMAFAALTFFAISASGATRAIEAIALGTVLKLAPIGILIGVGLTQNGIPTDITLPTFSAFESVALLLAFAFSGADIAVNAAGEAKNPRKTLMPALFANLAMVAVFYALVQLAYSASAPDPSRADIPLAAMGTSLLGPTGALMVSIAAIFSTATLTLNLFFLVPRILFGMGRRGLLPHGFAYVSPRFKSPVIAIAFFGAFVLVLALSGTFELLAELLVSTEQLAFLVTVGSLIVMWRRNDAGLRETMGFRWAIIIPVAIGYIIWLLLQLDANSVLYTVIMLVIGTALYLASKGSAVRQDGIDLPEGRAPAPKP